MVARHREEREVEALEELSGQLELRSATAVGEVARHHEDFGSKPRNQPAQGRERLGGCTAPEMEIRDMEDPSGHCSAKNLGRIKPSHTWCCAAVDRAVILVR